MAMLCLMAIIFSGCDCDDFHNLDCYKPLPTPQIVLDNSETVEINGETFTRYYIPVVNYADFDDALFTASPDLPPCGLNTSASRTWVDIFDENNNRIYGFCALGQASDLQGIWFAVKEGDPTPKEVCIKLTDRKCDRSVLSNKVEISCFTDLPDPILTFSGTEEYTTSAGTFVRYSIPVKNWEDYPDALFVASPDLPPCGLNTNASRSWVNIYNGNGNRIYGFCALGDNANLQNIWFAIPKGTEPPVSVYIIINDRKCEAEYKSNLLRL